jgi:transposase
VLFEYGPSRGGKVPVCLLDDFQCILQADGYSGYGKVCRDNHLTRIGCWDHARRKYVEASKAPGQGPEGATLESRCGSEPHPETVCD